MSTKNNVILAINSAWKDVQKSLTEFTYEKLAKKGPIFSNKILKALTNISSKEISVIKILSDKNNLKKEPVKVISKTENIRASFRESLIYLAETHKALMKALNIEKAKSFELNSEKRTIIDEGTFHNYTNATETILGLSQSIK